MFENLSILDFEELFKLLSDLYEEEPKNARQLLDDMKKYGLRQKKPINKYINDIQELLYDTECYDVDLGLLIDLIEKDATTLGLCMALPILITQIKEDLENYNLEFDEAVERVGGGKIRDKDRKRIISKTVKEDYKVSKIINEFNVMRKYYEDLETI